MSGEAHCPEELDFAHRPCASVRARVRGLPVLLGAGLTLSVVSACGVRGSQAEASTEVSPGPADTDRADADPRHLEPTADDDTPDPIPDWDEDPNFPPVDLSAIEPLEFVEFPKFAGGGYKRVKTELGPSLYSAKWLSITDRNARTFGPNHLIVRHFSARPDQYGQGKLTHSVLFDTRSGEAIVEFQRRGITQWRHGFSVVYKKDDPHPYLLNTESKELVAITPRGVHGYIFGKNFNIRFSHIAKRVWIVAEDDDGTEYKDPTTYIYEWEDLTAPPELPAGPFHFAPWTWDPYEMNAPQTETEEVISREPEWDECGRVALVPPRDHRCVHPRSEALTQGWRLRKWDGLIYNPTTGEGYDFAALCTDGPMRIEYLNLDPLLVTVTCREQPDRWFVWSPNRSLRSLDSAQASLVNDYTKWVFYHSISDTFELITNRHDGVKGWFSNKRRVRDLVGRDYSCPDLVGIGAGEGMYGKVCRKTSGKTKWVELVFTDLQTRSRFSARELVISPSGGPFVIVHRGGQDHLVRVIPPGPDHL